MNAAVLVVENDRDLRELDRRYLEWAGHAGPRTTGPAEEALHLWKSGGGKAGRNWRAVRRRAGAVAGLASTRQRPWAAARQKVNYHLKALEAHGLVSSTENSLARGLRDAAAVARAHGRSRLRRPGSVRRSGSRRWLCCSRHDPTSVTPS